jgi:hypothetical protein
MTSPSPNNKFDVRVGQFVKVRDLIAEIKERHKEELKKPTETLELLNSALLAHLIQVGADSVNIKGVGTVSRTTKKTASIEDMSAFWTFIVSQGLFEMVDKKANVPRVEEYMKENNGSLPPGVNFSSIDRVGVRRANGT